jgi:hypothetical protein
MLVDLAPEEEACAMRQSLQQHDARIKLEDGQNKQLWDKYGKHTSASEGINFSPNLPGGCCPMEKASKPAPTGDGRGKGEWTRGRDGWASPLGMEVGSGDLTGDRASSATPTDRNNISGSC